MVVSVSQAMHNIMYAVKGRYQGKEGGGEGEEEEEGRERRRRRGGRGGGGEGEGRGVGEEKRGGKIKIS